jgi:D-alanyl-D-alanine carboxypeptidase/D-alanyl-D-alanine-endopeptidase (penicillin-binding protein 4)
VLSALPVAGREPGTLRSRLVPIEGRVRAKTGSMRNTTSLSGYVSDQDGRELVFVIVANLSGTPTSVTNATIDRVVRVLADGQAR